MSSMSKLQKRSDERKLLVQISPITRMMEVETLTRTRSREMATMIKEARGEIPMIRSLRK